MSFSDFAIKGSDQRSTPPMVEQESSQGLDHIKTVAIESLKKISVDDLFSAKLAENEQLLQASIINYPAILSFLAASQYFSIDVGYSFLKLTESYSYENNPIIAQTIETISKDPVKRKKVIERLISETNKNPLDLMLISYRAWFYTLEQKPDLALKDYCFLIEKNPRDANAYLNRGLIKFHQNDFDCIADFESFLNVLGVRNIEEYLHQKPLDSTVLEVLLTLSQRYFKLEEYRKAIDQMLILKQHVEKFPKEHFSAFEQFFSYKDNLDFWLKSVVLQELKEKGFNSYRAKNWDQSIEYFELFLKTISYCQKYYKIDCEIANLVAEASLCKGIAHEKKDEFVAAIECFTFAINYLSFAQNAEKIRLYALFNRAVCYGLIDKEEEFLKEIDNYLLALDEAKDISDVPASAEECNKLITEVSDHRVLFKINYDKLKIDIYNRQYLSNLLQSITNLDHEFLKETFSKKEFSKTVCEALEYHLCRSEDMLNSLYRFYHMTFKSIVKDYKAAFEDFSLLDCYQLDQNFGNTTQERINYVTNVIANSISKNDLDDFLRKNPNNPTALYIKILKNFSSVSYELTKDAQHFLKLVEIKMNVNSNMISYMKCNLLLLLVNQNVQVDDEIKNKLKTIVFDHRFMQTCPNKIELYKRFVIMCMKLKDSKSIQNLLGTNFLKSICENSDEAEIELKLQTFIYAGMGSQALVFTNRLPKNFWSPISCMQKLNLTTLYARILYLNGNHDDSAVMFVSCIDASQELFKTAVSLNNRGDAALLLKKKISLLEDFKILIEKLKDLNSLQLNVYVEKYLEHMPYDKDIQLLKNNAK